MLKRNDGAHAEYGARARDLPAQVEGPVEGQVRAQGDGRYVGRLALWIIGMAAFIAFILSGLAKCPTAGLFHVPCPACGSTRTAQALLHLDFAGVLRNNPVALLVIPILAGIAWRTLTLVFYDGHAKRLDEEKLGRFFLVALVWAVGLEFVVWGARFFFGFLGGPCPI